ncbi:MAG: hypothetical protein L6Q57_06230 [Alphaproteobacteria bacterium]|nr:hypothetical protein [Alphaproteobacteria bacterium]
MGRKVQRPGVDPHYWALLEEGTPTAQQKETLLKIGLDPENPREERNQSITFLSAYPEGYSHHVLPDRQGRLNKQAAPSVSAGAPLPPGY